MAINDPSKVNRPEVGTAEQPQTTSQPKQDAPKTIWAGMTRSEASLYNLIDMFNKANENSDEVLSEDEYNAFIKNQNAPTEIKSNSGKRIAVNGKYTVKKGDTLSKIAADFNIDVYVLYQQNRSTMPNINTLDIGQVLVIKKETKTEKNNNDGTQETQGSQQTQNNRKIKPLVLSDAAKKALSEALGVDVSSMSAEELAQKAITMDFSKLMQCFQLVMKNSTDDDLKNLMGAITNNNSVAATVIAAAKNLDSPEKIQQVVEQLTKALGEDVSKLSIKDLMQKLQGLNSGKQTQLVKNVLIKTIGDSEAVHTEFKNHNGEITKEEFDDFYGITDEIKSESDVHKQLDMIAKAVGDKILADMDLNNPDSFVNQSIADIKNGHLTEYEQKAHGKDVSKLSEEEIIQIAKQRVHNAHTNIFASAMTNDIINDNLDEYTKKLELYVSEAVRNAMGDTEETGIIAGMTANVIGSKDVSAEHKEQLASIMGGHSKELGVDNLDDDLFRVVTNAVYGYGNEESTNKYTIDNAKRADILADVIRDLQSETTNPDRANILNNALNTVTNIQANGGVAGGSSAGGYRANVSQQANYNIESNYSSNPIYSNYTNDVIAIREASNRFHNNSDKKITQDQIKQQELEKLEEIRREMMSRMRIKMAELKNKPLGEALSEVLKYYDQMPSHVKEHFVNHITQFANAHKDLACKAYITGDDDLKEFLQKQHIVTRDDVFEFFDNHESEIKYAPQLLQIEYYKYKSQEQ